MDYLGFVSLTIFIITLFLLLKRPKGINIGIAAGIGALASLLFGTVTLNDTYYALTNIWDAALAFLGIVTFSIILDAMGFFRWAAIRVAKMAGGHGVKLFFFIAMLSATVSILFANDSAILILTPIVIEMIYVLDLTEKNKLAYLFCAGLIADTAAMPLITSNPINIVSADFFKYTFVEHLIFMAPVAIVTLIVSMLVIYLFFRKDIPKSYSLKTIETLIINSPRPKWLRTSIVTLIAIDVGYVVASLNRIPVSFVICLGAIFLFILYLISCRRELMIKEEERGAKFILKRINWDILFFMIAIFLVVQGLKHVGIIELFASLFINASALPLMLSILVPSLIITVAASGMNNWPMTMLGLLSIKQAILAGGLTMQASTSLIFANIIGNNLGAHFFPFGSLAILMWLGTMKRKGLTIKLRDYVKIGVVLSLLEVAIASLILWLEQLLFQLSLNITI
ncbi:MAG TPA: ArsB/NhaD family transporter [Candidatus Deferrimicrobium sp.]|nr:ArsB/NhaD family transporter [Candidatus Deferrimicrobium sp.]